MAILTRQGRGFMSRHILIMATSASLWLATGPSAYAAGRIEVGANGPSSADLVGVDQGTQLPVSTIRPFGTVTGGIRVGTCDVNADGTADLIAVPGPGSAPRVIVFDGRSGSPVADFFAFSPGFTGGLYVAGGDVDGDGHCDLVVAPDAGAGPEVKVFSGRDGSVLADFFAYPAGVTAGVRVAAGDVDGDGRADVVTGPGSGYPPVVRVYKVQGLDLLHDFYAFANTFLGGVYVAAADINFDGRADLIVGAGSGLPQVSEFNGVDHGVIANFLAFDAGFSGGVRVGAGDSNGDGDGVSEIAMATGPGATQVKLTYASSPPPASGFFPLGNNTDGSFVAIAPRSGVIFADHFQTP